MIKMGDKLVYNTSEEILDPSHTALVLWDVLQAFTKMIFNYDEFITNLKALVQVTRGSKVPIFFTSLQMLPTRFESSAILYTLSKLGFDKLFEGLSPEDMDFIISPGQDEVVINKHTASIFIDTGFERMLRNARIGTVVFTGIATEFGVESSVRDAFNRGFYPVVASDCVSSPNKEGHERSLENMKSYTMMLSSIEIQKIWKNN
jgi:nicotinamidase-related amidase